MQINPYETGSVPRGDAVQQRCLAFVVKVCAGVSFLICMLLVLLACWAWWQWWRYQGTRANVSSFPYGAFARQATQWAAVGCASVIAMWSVFWCIWWPERV
ncbi:MAG: hypothetical protein CMM01_11995 [Rhodopirellula sp.]|nr:hypothetical protein [Rhodopirellula sp.]